MPNAHDIPGNVFKNGSALFLARVVDVFEQPILPGELSEIRYSISLLDESSPDAEQPVVGHVDQALDIHTTVFDQLQLDATWDIDAIGYNFRHELDVSTHPAFAAAGLTYRVQYRLTPTAGAPILVRFRLHCI